MREGVRGEVSRLQSRFSEDGGIVVSEDGIVVEDDSGGGGGRGWEVEEEGFVEDGDDSICICSMFSC